MRGGRALRTLAPVDAERVLYGVIGAVVGAFGWFLVALFMQRRDFMRRGRHAGRAVYFELGVNHLNVFVALEYGTFAPLARATFDRLLPELAAWLPASELQALALAYMGHAGYQQAAEDQRLPAPMRKELLRALADTHREAVELLRRRAFSSREVRTLLAHASVEQQRLVEAANRGAS